jgi:hypothetical protein
MNFQVRTGPRPAPLALILVSVCFAAFMPAAGAEESANPATMTFAAGGTIRMKLHRGTMEIVGVPDDKITVSWHSRVPKDERDVSVRLERSAPKEATMVVDGPGERMRYRIEVPQHSDVVIDMQAGELQVHDILGSMDIELVAGEIDLRVADPGRYRILSAAVTAGELDARPWRANSSGVWQSFKVTGDGEYDLRVRLLAGQLVIRSQ